MRHQTAIGAAALSVGLAVAMSAPATGATSRTAPAPKPDPRSIAAGSADRAIAAQPSTFKLAAEDKIVDLGVTSGLNGLQYVAYTRTHAGLPVQGGDFVVVTNAAGGVLSTHVNQTRELDVDTKAKISAAAAAKTSRAHVAKVEKVSAPKLTVLANGAGRLVYETVVTGTKKNNAPTIMHVYVDAKSGKVVESWDQVRDAADDRSHYHGTVDISTAATTMSDPQRGNVQCGGQNGRAYTGDSQWGNGSGTDMETACVDAMYAHQKEWDMLKEWLGRNGINGRGGGFPMRVALNAVNAYWNGSYTTYGHNQANNRQATSVDVVGHENGHAIFTTTPGGDSGGGNEKGGLNESTGDIFGTLTEFYMNEPANLDPPDYLVGEEVDLVGQGPIRNMYNPQEKRHPNCYSSSIPRTEVHAAAGPQNHWFYLLAEGSNPGGGKPTSPTCNSSTVTGIGVQKAGKIFMETLNRKTSSWTHSTVRAASVAAAKQLFPGSTTECQTVKAAWSAVSVPQASGEPAC
ncbi:M4 family metallopeptidase [Actinomadura spongiicola]|nr:M4 family metallopeptidase [Actinomadura spongiicola]